MLLYKVFDLPHSLDPVEGHNVPMSFVQASVHLTWQPVWTLVRSWVRRRGTYPGILIVRFPVIFGLLQKDRVDLAVV